MKRQYLVVLEKGENNYSAFSPDVLGCASTGRTFEETLSNMQDALEFHLEGDFNVRGNIKTVVRASYVRPETRKGKNQGR